MATSAIALIVVLVVLMAIGIPHYLGARWCLHQCHPAGSQPVTGHDYTKNIYGL